MGKKAEIPSVYFPIRIPPELMERIRLYAHQKKTSMNKACIEILDRGLLVRGV